MFSMMEQPSIVDKNPFRGRYLLDKMRDIGLEEAIKDPEKMREMLEDPSFLPTRDFVKKAFTIASGKYKGKRDIYEFGKFCDGREDEHGMPIYVHEILTEEYIAELAEHYSESIMNFLIKNPNDKFVLLELGAGDGRLAGFLRRELVSRFGEKVAVEAADKYAEGTGDFSVTKMDYKDALDRYKPNAVIVSWMPHQDWTKDFRDPNRNIKEYILIGESDEGVSGTEDTWDPYLVKKEGFAEEKLERATLAQISHTDRGFDRSDALSLCRSETKAFKRVGD
jgi:hypothetical protein